MITESPLLGAYLSVLLQEARVYGNIGSKDGAHRNAVPAEQLTYYTTKLVALLDKQPSEVLRVCEIGFAGTPTSIVWVAL